MKQSRQLIFGFYDAVGNPWRWTAPEFAVTLGLPFQDHKPTSLWKSASLHVDLYFPPYEISQLGPITLSASSPGYSYSSVTFSTAGPHEYVSEVPVTALCTNLLPVRFTLDKFMHGSGADTRDLGVVVTSVKLLAKN